jgi:hypothetical protein
VFNSIAPGHAHAAADTAVAAAQPGAADAVA